MWFLRKTEDREADEVVEWLRHEAIARLEHSIRAADAAEIVLAQGAPTDCAEVREVRQAIHEANEAVLAYVEATS